jgi:putative effector of murein hydrolase
MIIFSLNKGITLATLQAVAFALSLYARFRKLEAYLVSLAASASISSNHREMNRLSSNRDVLGSLLDP